MVAMLTSCSTRCRTASFTEPDWSPDLFLGFEPTGFMGGDTNLTRFVGNDTPNEVDPSGLEHFPSERRGKWVEGTRGNGVFEYFDTPQNQAAGVAGKRVRFTNGCIGIGGFPAEFYYGGSADAATVPIETVKGTDADFTAADAKMREKLNDPNWQRPRGYTWNHAGEPGSKEMELISGDPHSRIAHTGSASAPRAASRAARLSGGAARALAVGTVYMGIRDACQAAGAAQPDYAAVEEEYYFVDEDGSVFTIKEPQGLRSLVTDPWKNYLAGPRAGKTEAITGSQAEEYRNQAEAKYGKYHPGSWLRQPTFTPGTDRKTLPLTNEGGRIIGYLDEEGIHETRPWMPDSV